MRRRCEIAREQRDKLLRLHILAGGTPKAFAIDHGISLAYTCIRLREIGIECVYLTREERDKLRSLRAA